MVSSTVIGNRLLNADCVIGNASRTKQRKKGKHDWRDVVYKIELDALQNQGKRNRPGSHCSGDIRQGEFLPSPARRDKPGTQE